MKTLFKTCASFALAALLFLCITICFTGAAKPSANRYSAYATITAVNVSTEQIYYTDKSESKNSTVKDVPFYTQMASLPGSCGATAGAIIVAFYDKYFEELVPDYQTALPTGKYKNADTVYIPKLMSELYTLMRTNVDGEGVSVVDCIAGLDRYVYDRGHAASYTSIYYAGSVDESSLVTVIDENRPVLLFCRNINLITLSSSNGYDTVTYNSYVGSHVAVGYGYRYIDYYSNGSLVRTDKYIMVATGLDISKGYIKVTSYDWCDGAYAVSIK